MLLLSLLQRIIILTLLQRVQEGFETRPGVGSELYYIINPIQIQGQGYRGGGKSRAVIAWALSHRSGFILLFIHKSGCMIEFYDWPI